MKKISKIAELFYFGFASKGIVRPSLVLNFILGAT
jgi:hypothetical protein